MTKSKIMHKTFFKTLLVSFSVLAYGYAMAKGEDQAMPQHVSAKNLTDQLSVKSDVPYQENDVTDLKFGEFFNMPIGPRGLEPTNKLIRLEGKRVRIIGYMVHQESPQNGFFILAPLPIALGDGDENLAEDLPAGTIFVHIEKSAQVVPYHSGAIRLTGTLQLGPYKETNGHVSLVRLQLDPELTQFMMSRQLKK